MSKERAIPLILNSQFNHIAHLDTEITELRVIMDKRFEQVDKRFERLEKNLFAGFGLLVAIITLFRFIH